MTTPQNANDFIEQQLDDRAKCLEDTHGADVLAFEGPLLFSVDDAFRTMVEELRATSQKKKLAIVLTTLGGYIEVVQRIVETLRHHYDVIDFIIPNYAFSAGTVLAMSGDSIWMDYYSRLGPIDPQVEGPDKRNMVPALGYLVQWQRLLEKAQKGTLTTVEAQLMISGPGFDQASLYQYEQARDLSVSLLKEWLVKYKFKDWTRTESRKKPVTPAMKTRRAGDIARKLNASEKWHSHESGISMEVLRRDLNVKIDDFGAKSDLAKCIKDYYNLLSDYMRKLDKTGVLHRRGKYLPFM
ncbi:MAG: serine dehydrogenasease [Chloroflexi bacterium]|nr:serine dehydrogenasease [Chloroflexota bacterium]